MYARPGTPHERGENGVALADIHRPMLRQAQWLECVP